MESEEVGGCDPGDKLNRRLAALRKSPEKADTIDALEWTESGREECDEEEDKCGSTTNPVSATAQHAGVLEGVTNFGEQKRIGAQLVPRSVPSTHLRIARRGWHATVGTRHRCSGYWSDPESNGRRNGRRWRTPEGPAHSLLRALPTVELMSSCTEVKIAR